MKVSVSILSIKDNIKENVKKLEYTTADYIHLDIMDGVFVSNKTWNIGEINDIVSNNNKPLDIHLMVSNLDKYINEFLKLKPRYITFHYEATNEINKYISILKENNIGVGLSIKPNTDISALKPYLPFLDLVLIMSVEPGLGGQKFIDSSLTKIKVLKELKNKNNYNYLIEVDGGINNETVSLVSDAGVDIVVSGSYITNSDNYEEMINNLKKN